MRIGVSSLPGTMLVGLVCIVFVVALSNPVGAQQNVPCSNAQEVATLGPTTTDDRLPFETTTDRFRVSYEVDFEDDDSIIFRDFTVDITDRFGLVESDSTDADAQESFIVVEDPGSFAIETDVEPENGATYTVIVEECGGAAGGGAGNGGATPAEDQYPDANPDDVNTPDDVIVDTIPDKKILANTGGFPLLAGAGLMLVAAIVVGTGVIVRR